MWKWKCVWIWFYLPSVFLGSKTGEFFTADDDTVATTGVSVATDFGVLALVGAFTFAGVSIVVWMRFQIFENESSPK